MSEVVQLPDHIAGRRYFNGKPERTTPIIREWGEQVCQLQPGQALQIKASRFNANAIVRKVRWQVEKRGFRMESRQDGLGNLYLMKGDPYFPSTS